MSETAEAIVSHAHNKANRRTSSTRVKSKVASKLRKYKKPRNIVSTAVNTAIEFIPIPGVGAVAGWTESKVSQMVRTKLRKRRADTAEDDYRQMKIAIKDLDGKALDEARHKVQRNIKLYNNLSNKKNSGPCQQAYNIAYRFYRVENRLDKLEAMAGAMSELSQEILRWTEESREKLKEDDMAKNVNAALGGNHKKCGKNCVNGFNDKDSLLSAGVSAQVFREFATEMQSDDASNGDFD